MDCPECGVATPEGARFCAKCGTELPAVSAVSAISPEPVDSGVVTNCPNCGVDTAPGIKFCGQCGHSLAQITGTEPVKEPEPVAEIESGIETEQVIETEPVAETAPGLEIEPVKEIEPVAETEPEIETEPVEEPEPIVQTEPEAGIGPGITTGAGISLAFLQVPFIKQAAVVVSGAILMLISLGVPWYSTKLGTLASGDLLSSDKVRDVIGEDIIWAGWGLSIMFVIIISSLVLLSVIVSLWTQKAQPAFWYVTGILAFICVIANAGYVGWWTHDNEIFSGGLVHAGFVLSLIGSILLWIGAGMRTETAEP